MTCPEPTADEYLAAYKASRLRWSGISLQKALSTPSVRASLRMSAIVLSKKEQQKHGKPAPLQQARI
jgi:hypothetical protein